MKFEVKVLELSEEDIATVMSGASYGIAYWCSEMGLEEGKYQEYRNEGDCIEDVYARALKDGCAMVFTDIEDDEKYFLTYDRLLKSVQKFIESGRCLDISNIFKGGNEDSDDMDFIIQYALFDKIVFC